MKCLTCATNCEYHRLSQSTDQTGVGQLGFRDSVSRSVHDGDIAHTAMQLINIVAEEPAALTEIRRIEKR